MPTIIRLNFFCNQFHLLPSFPFQGNNGPGVITRVLQQLCDTKDVLKMISSNECKNFRVLPIESCYSIRWPEHVKFFKPEFLNETLERLSDSIIAHVWNKHSAATPLTLDSNVAYIHLAKKFCPKVVKASEFFWSSEVANQTANNPRQESVLLRNRRNKSLIDQGNFSCIVSSWGCFWIKVLF